MEDLKVPSIDVISKSSVVVGDDIEFLKTHAVKFDKRFRTRSMFRTKAEMEGGVLNDDEHPTPDSKYWQAIGEQNVMLTELISLDFESKKHEADQELLAIEIEEMTASLAGADGYEKKKLEARLKKKKVEFDQSNFGRMHMTKTANERMKEIRLWEPIIEELEGQLKYGTEDVGLHHPERYFLRYKRRMDNLQLVNPEARESVVSHTKSFASLLEKSPQVVNIPPGLPETSSQVDYKAREDMDKDDPIAKQYFDRKVRTIRVATPHRNKGDKNATNFFAMQTPAGFNTDLTEPYGYTIPDSRNGVVKQAIEDGIDYIFFVDDDTIIPRNALVKLMKHNTDVVGGLYYRKYNPVETVSMHETAEGQPCSIDDYKIGDLIHNTLVMASGCSLLKVSALKKIEFPWYKTITVNGRPTLTEDTYFCQKLKDIGVDIITDTAVQCIHVDIVKGVFYGHPDIIDVASNSIKPEWRDFFAI